MVLLRWREVRLRVRDAKSHTFEPTKSLSELCNLPSFPNVGQVFADVVFGIDVGRGCRGSSDCCSNCCGTVSRRSFSVSSALFENLPSAIVAALQLEMRDGCSRDASISLPREKNDAYTSTDVFIIKTMWLSPFSSIRCLGRREASPVDDPGPRSLSTRS